MNFFFSLVKKNPEFDSFITSLEEIQFGEVSLIQELEKTFSEYFNKFSKDFPSEISKGINPIHSLVNNQIGILQQNFLKLNVLPKDLEFLNNKRFEILKKKENLNNIKEETRKSKLKVYNIQTSLENLQKGTLEYEKIQKSLEQAQENENLLINRENEQLLIFEKDLKEFKINFINALCTSLSAAALERKNVAEQLIYIGNEIEKTTNQITNYHDASISSLRRHLQNLEYEVVD